MKLNNTLLASTEITYFEIQYKNLEAFLINDPPNFYRIWKHNMKSYTLISKQERQESNAVMRSFNNNPQPAMLVLEDGRI